MLVLFGSINPILAWDMEKKKKRLRGVASHSLIIISETRSLSSSRAPVQLAHLIHYTPVLCVHPTVHWYPSPCNLHYKGLVSNGKRSG